jgi:flagellar hook-basal body complex protein FliE
MVAVQKASLSFQQVVQIRNRVIAAYHDVMNMQV